MAWVRLVLAIPFLVVAVVAVGVGLGVGVGSAAVARLVAGSEPLE